MKWRFYLRKESIMNKFEKAINFVDNCSHSGDKKEVDLIISSLNKQIPMNVIVKDKGTNGAVTLTESHCPNCKRLLDRVSKYCPDCGQSLVRINR